MRYEGKTERRGSAVADRKILPAVTGCRLRAVREAGVSRMGVITTPAVNAYTRDDRFGREGIV